MDIKVIRVKHYNSNYKRLVMVDGEPVCIVSSGKRASECIQYLCGYNADINDGKIKKLLDRYRLPSVGKDTEIRKKREGKHKVVHGFRDLGN